jgi:hypothetical protein
MPASPSITVISPAPGQIWNRNGLYPISWEKKGLMDEYVRICLLQGETQVLEIISSTSNNGLLKWSLAWEGNLAG